MSLWSRVKQYFAGEEVAPSARVVKRAETKRAEQRRRYDQEQALKRKKIVKKLEEIITDDSLTAEQKTTKMETVIFHGRVLDGYFPSFQDFKEYYDKVKQQEKAKEFVEAAKQRVTRRVERKAATEYKRRSDDVLLNRSYHNTRRLDDLYDEVITTNPVALAPIAAVTSTVIASSYDSFDSYDNSDSSSSCDSSSCSCD